MNREQIEKWAQEVGAIRTPSGGWCLYLTHAEQFARLAEAAGYARGRKAALEEAAREIESVSRFEEYEAGDSFKDYIAQRLRALIDKEPS